MQEDKLEKTSECVVTWFDLVVQGKGRKGLSPHHGFANLCYEFNCSLTFHAILTHPCASSVLGNIRETVHDGHSRT